MFKEREEIIWSNIWVLHSFALNIIGIIVSVSFIYILITFFSNFTKNEEDKTEIGQSFKFLCQNALFLFLYMGIVYFHSKLEFKYPIISQYYGEGLVIFELVVCASILKMDNWLKGFDSFPFLFCVNAINMLLFSKEWKRPLAVCTISMLIFFFECKFIVP